MYTVSYFALSNNQYRTTKHILTYTETDIQQTLKTHTCTNIQIHRRTNIQIHRCRNELTCQNVHLHQYQHSLIQIYTFNTHTHTHTRTDYSRSGDDSGKTYEYLTRAAFEMIASDHGNLDEGITLIQTGKVVQ